MDGPALGGRRSGLRGRTVRWFGRPNLTTEGWDIRMSLRYRRQCSLDVRTRVQSTWYGQIVCGAIFLIN